MHGERDPAADAAWSPKLLFRFRLAIAIALLLSHLALQLAMRRVGENPNIIFNDGVGYYSYIHSLVFDRDMDFRNQYARLTSYSAEVKRFWLRNPLPDGRPRNIYAVGPAIFWSPFFVLGHLAARVAPGGFGWPADGYSLPYQLAIVLGSFLYGLAGAFLLERLLRGRFPAHVACAAAWASVLATPVVYYMLFEPSMAHATDFFAVTVFLLGVERFRRGRPTLPGAFLLGFAVGLLFLVRWINAIFLAWAALALWSAGREHRTSPAELGRLIVALAAGSLVGMLPQLLVWKDLYGGYLVVPGGQGYFRFSLEGFWGTLFSTRNGLYVWTPIAAAGTVGLFFHRGWERRERSLFFLLFLLAVSVNALVHDWWGGDSFGMRRLIGFFPFLAFGLGEAIGWTERRLGATAVFAILAGLIGLNGYLMIARKLGLWPA